MPRVRWPIVIIAAIGLGGAPPAAAMQANSKEAMSRAETEELVRRDLAERLKVPAAQLTVVSASDRTWPDANLGCGARKGVLEPAPVPGFAFTFTHAGRRYEYHSDRRGQFRRCDAVKRRGPISR
jgi:hypothetical protein